MQINLTHLEMQEAIWDYISRKFKIEEGNEVTIEFAASGRERNIFSTNVEVVQTQPSNSGFLKVLKRIEKEPEGLTINQIAEAAPTISQTVGAEGVASTASMGGSEPAVTAVDEATEEQTTGSTMPERLARTNPFSVALTGKVTDVDAGTVQETPDPASPAEGEAAATTPKRSSLFRGVGRPVN